MKYFICFLLFGAVLIQAHAQQHEAEMEMGAEAEAKEIDPAKEEYLARFRKSPNFPKAKSYGAPSYSAPAAPTYAAPAPSYAAPAPSYAAPAPAYSAPLTYNVPGPSIPCSKAVIVSCAPTVQSAPCSAPPASYGGGY